MVVVTTFSAKSLSISRYKHYYVRLRADNVSEAGLVQIGMLREVHLHIFFGSSSIIFISIFRQISLYSVVIVICRFHVDNVQLASHSSIVYKNGF